MLERYCAPRARVLLVEDQPDARAQTRSLIAKQGFAVIEAANGREALERLAAEATAPDLILLDLLMPEMDGFEFLVERRANAAWREIPVVVLTGKELTEEDHLRLNGGVAGIMRKGAVSQGEFLAELRRVLDGGPRTVRPAAAALAGGGAST